MSGVSTTASNLASPDAPAALAPPAANPAAASSPVSPAVTAAPATPAPLPVAVTVATTPTALRDALAAHAADVLVVVLDSAAAASPDGIALVKRLSPEADGVQVIYVDASGTHATRAYETVHLCLLPWPLPGDLLLNALHRALVRIERWSRRPIVVHTNQGERAVLPRKVAYVESDRRVLHIHLVGGETVSTYGKLSEMARLLPASFVQSHKSFLVNMALIEVLGRDAITLTTGESVPVSQKRRRSTREAFRAFVGRCI